MVAHDASQVASFSMPFDRASKQELLQKETWVENVKRAGGMAKKGNLELCHQGSI